MGDDRQMTWNEVVAENTILRKRLKQLNPSTFWGGLFLGLAVGVVLGIMLRIIGTP